VALHGNGFIAAFAGGLGFAAAGGQAAQLVPFVEETGTLVSLLVWLLFGVIAVVPALQSLTWQTVAYAVLSLTIIRMLPVAVALIGSRLGHATVAFVGWFGPRGLASVVFALLTLEDLGGPAAKPVTAVIAFTVLLRHGDEWRHQLGRFRPGAWRYRRNCRHGRILSSVKSTQVTGVAWGCLRPGRRRPLPCAACGRAAGFGPAPAGARPLVPPGTSTVLARADQDPTRQATGTWPAPDCSG
jgi:hypothetical protein